MEFWIPSRSRVRLALYDVTGRRVRTLVNGDLERDWHRAEWDGSDDHGRAAATGSYFLRLDVAGHAPALKRVLLMR
jgi:flagellar hook assembly protein FlgD